jgi:hypothetical protein
MRIIPFWNGIIFIYNIIFLFLSVVIRGFLNNLTDFSVGDLLLVQIPIPVKK